MSSQSEKVRILVCSGGEWELINGVLEYMPLGLMKRALVLPLDITQSSLVNLVAKKLSLIDTHSSAFKLSYKFPPRGDVVELVDDDDLSVFMDVAVQMLPETVTLFVSKYVSSSGNQSDSRDNHSGPTISPCTYQELQTQQISVQTTLNNKSDLVHEREPTSEVGISDKTVNLVELDNASVDLVELETERVDCVKLKKRQIDSVELEYERGDCVELKKQRVDCVELDKENGDKENVKLATPVPLITPSGTSSSSHVTVRQFFNSKKDLKQALRLKCVEDGFKIKITKSCKDRFEAVCFSGKCEWRIRAVMVKGTDVFQVRKLEDRHTCL